MDSASARIYLLALPGITEHDHFGRPAYRSITSKGKPSNIFMTLWVEDQRAVLLLNVEQQAELQQQQHVDHEYTNSRLRSASTRIAESC